MSARRSLWGRVTNGVIAGILRLPYRWRVPLAGWFMAAVVARVAGWRARVRDNLALVAPDLTGAEVRRLQRAVPDNFGRTLIEIYSGAEFAARAAGWPVTGGGLPALQAARAEGRPVLLINAHFGNFDAVRAALIARGFAIGGLYRPMRDAAFNAPYVRALAGIGEPIFPRGREGMAGMVRFLRQGGMLIMLIDQQMSHGAPLRFFGRTAWTALSAAKLALKHDALVVPVYGRRLEDGLSFEVIVEPPVPHATPEAMTQALNDSLEARVRADMGQWFWIHRRWKGRGRNRAAAAAEG